MPTYTDIDEIPVIREKARAAFATGKTRSIDFRKGQLLQLAYMMQDNTERWETALRADLHRPASESLFLEISAVLKEAMVAYSSVKSWAKPEGVPFDFNTFLMGGKTVKEPQGTVLIIGPFNYPLWCLLTPLVGAIAAGCAAVIKPSEVSSATAAVLEELIPKYLDNDLYKVVTAEIPGTTKLLELQWDHIMYTGNGTVGRIVATAAAKHLTPVSLELGGKSPVVVDDSADLKLTAKRVLWAKVVNAGQTCVAPDYVLVSEKRQDALVAAFKEAHAEFYGSGAVQESDDYSRIVAERHFDRIKALLDATKGEIVIGGQTDRDTKFIAPTIVKGVTVEDSLMKEEIFGPVLPIVPMKNLDFMINYINAHDKPLAVYSFASSSSAKQAIQNHTSSGMLMVNDCIVAASVVGLGFGGVGPSGYGAHSFKDGFDAFTHRKSTIDNPSWLDMILYFRFPPYNKSKRKLMETLLYPKIGPSRPRHTTPGMLIPSKSKGANALLIMTLTVAIGAVLAANGLGKFASFKN